MERKIAKLWVEVIGPYSYFIQEIKVIDNDIEKSMAEYKKYLGKNYRLIFNDILYQDQIDKIIEEQKN